MMKRLTYIIIITALILGAVACSGQGAVITTESAATPPATASPSPTAAILPTASALPSAEQSVTPSLTVTPAPAKDITVIIAAANTTAAQYGKILGGYSNGRWLTQSEAAKLCKGEMTFSEYNLVKLKGTIKSSGVNSGTLIIPGGGNAEADYKSDPLGFSYLYYGGNLPDIKIVSDTSNAKNAVQKLLDNVLGKGEAEANIWIAVSADIDGDGKKETVVNAGFVSQFFGDSPYPEYSMCCIIDSDGKAQAIGEYYDIPDSADPTWYYQGLFYVQNIIDIDEDGISELVVDESTGDEPGFSVYKYNGGYAEKIMDYDFGYAEPAEDEPSPTAGPVPELTVTPGDTDIPDVEFDISEYAAGWQNPVCEDDKYIYCLYSELYCINKSNKEVTTMSYVYNSTLYSGMVICVQGDSIKAYDPRTGKTKDILVTKGVLNNITVYKDLIYFTKADYGNQTEDIWSVNLDGSGEKCITKNTGKFMRTFCIYKDMIYYITYEFRGRQPNGMYKCNLDGSGEQKLLDVTGDRFQIYKDKLFNSDSQTIFDLNTGTETPIGISDFSGNHIVWGQYILYYLSGGIGNHDSKLYAYDLNTGETYYLMGTGYDAGLTPAFSDSAYVSLTDENGSHICRLIIKDGKAFLSRVMYIRYDPDQYHG